MSDQDLKNKVLEIISDHRTGVLSSVENNKPHSRYMTFYNEDLTLFTPTKLDTEKVEEIEKNPSVSVLLGYEKKGQNDSYVEIFGTSTINDSQDLKSQFWDESLNNGSTVLKIQTMSFYKYNLKRFVFLTFKVDHLKNLIFKGIVLNIQDDSYFPLSRFNTL